MDFTTSDAFFAAWSKELTATAPDMMDLISLRMLMCPCQQLYLKTTVVTWRHGGARTASDSASSPVDWRQLCGSCPCGAARSCLSGSLQTGVTICTMHLYRLQAASLCQACLTGHTALCRCQQSPQLLIFPSFMASGSHASRRPPFRCTDASRGACHVRDHVTLVSDR